MQHSITFETISASELRTTISDRLSEIGFGKQRFIVERHNKPIAAIVTVADAQLLEALFKKAYARVAEEAVLESETLVSLVESGLLETKDAEKTLQPAEID